MQSGPSLHVEGSADVQLESAGIDDRVVDAVASHSFNRRVLKYEHRAHSKWFLHLRTRNQPAASDTAVAGDYHYRCLVKQNFRQDRHQ